MKRYRDLIAEDERLTKKDKLIEKRKKSAKKMTNVMRSKNVKEIINYFDKEDYVE